MGRFQVLSYHIPLGGVKTWYVCIYLFKMGKMSTFWNIKKVFTQWDNAQAKEVFLN
jgi:hypothetical protein